jgi:lysophospholipid acyltransferase (LPLAT)-like uncharacterized protein
MNPVSSPPSSEPSPAKRKKSGIVIPHKPVWHQRLVAWIIYLIARAVTLSLRIRWEDHSGLLKQTSRGPVIFALWHNRLALCMEAYRVIGQPRNKLAALVSASKDGGLLSAILERFDAEAVRGSSSRRGAQGLLELTTSAEHGSDLAITPDGPRGPCYVVRDGVMSLAQVTGLPIIPASFNLKWKIQLKSWDRFQIPIPFSRCEMILGNPLSVPRDITDEQRAVLQKELERLLMEITRD